MCDTDQQWFNLHLDLLNTGSLKPQVIAVVGQRADLLMIAVITHADDGNLWLFYQTNHFLCGSKGQNHKCQETQQLSEYTAVQKSILHYVVYTLCKVCTFSVYKEYPDDLLHLLKISNIQQSLLNGLLYSRLQWLELLFPVQYNCMSNKLNSHLNYHYNMLYIELELYSTHSHWTHKNLDTIMTIFAPWAPPLVKRGNAIECECVFTCIPPLSSFPAIPSTSSIMRTCLLLTVWDAPDTIKHKNIQCLYYNQQV